MTAPTTAPQIPTPTKDAPVRRKRSPWPYAIVIVFGVQACVLTTTIVLASRMPSNAEPGYYDKALAWNDRASALAVPRQAGWASVATVHRSTVTLNLADAESRPITNAAVSATAFHRTTALDRHSLSFVETAPGTYRASIPSEQSGIWEVRFEILADGHGPAALTKTIEIH
jgi:nitrogen fixation protein FixH